jgi:hypothetical protein
MRTPAVTPESVGPKPLILKTSAVKRPVVDTDKKSTVNGVVDNGKLKTHNGHRPEPQPTAMLTAKVLSACLKQPKEASDRKSNFFKLMRRESHESNVIELNHTESTGNLLASLAPTDANKMKFMSHGTDATELNFADPDDHSPHDDSRSSVAQSPTASISSPVEVVFSSEGELRLMQEMGWNEADYDGEDYEITDDDVREFQALCHRLQHEQLSCLKPHHNGSTKANGYVAKILGLGSNGNNLPASSVDSDFSADDSDVSNS